MISSILESFANLFRKSDTIHYPLEPLPKSKNYRGLIEYDEEHCIFCYKCEKVCPPSAIIFREVENQKHRHYQYDSYLCIYCGECVRSCPKAQTALWQADTKPKVGTLSDKNLQSLRNFKETK